MRNIYCTALWPGMVGCGSGIGGGHANLAGAMTEAMLDGARLGRRLGVRQAAGAQDAAGTRGEGIMAKLARLDKASCPTMPYCITTGQASHYPWLARDLG